MSAPMITPAFVPVVTPFLAHEDFRTPGSLKANRLPRHRLTTPVRSVWLHSMKRRTIVSPIGPLTAIETNRRITRLEWGGGFEDHSTVLDAAAAQLTQYFEGSRRSFDLPLQLGKTPFQERFLQILLDIPFGETRTYGALAKTLGISAQAVGQACGANPIPVIVPCHRVLAANGLGGFSGAGGIEAKVALLRHESAASLLL